MITRKLIYLVVLCAMFSAALTAQQQIHHQSTEYEWPADPLVKDKLEQWRDQKFGMIIHWGLYAVPGMIESWALCSEDWITRDSTVGYDDFKKWYWGLKKDFNPVKFNPDQWAGAAKDAGMRYVVFTTKHHDGFCMFDTKETDFKISNGPFAGNPKANVAKYVFEAFRKEGMMIGAYFSKPDWHSENFWWPMYATADRNTNYDIRKFPWRWDKFKSFTYNQISELMNDYGKMDILWLDGGWVRPLETVNDEVRSWGADIPAWSQDIDMPGIASMARKAQPGLLIVDRTVHGPYENYQTPEQQIPKEKLDHPWESCITLGNAWGYVPNEHFKSSAKVIHQLIEVVAKGGSLLLGVGPTAEGLLQQEAVSRLGEIGEWMKVNGKAIYGTRTTDFYHDGNVYFTRSKDSSTLYSLVCLQENTANPATVEWSGNIPKKGSKMQLLQTGANIKWTTDGIKVTAYLPAAIQKSTKKLPALAFAFSPEPAANANNVAPKPVEPLPSAPQLAWHEMETNAFVHFTTNTFTGLEWGNGDEKESIFNPTNVDTRQWAKALKDAGFKTLILTCKHHDGFCLWPSKYTEHSIKNSPYKNGKGDLVREVSDACKEFGLKFGVYLSPWDRNHPDYGKPAYIEYYRNQLKELFTGYGPVVEMWFDGANGGSGYYGGANETRKINAKTYYDWPGTLSLVRSMQPNVVFFSDAGPGVRWVGNESGIAGETNWNTISTDTLFAGKPGVEALLNTGAPDGNKWIPAEVDVSIRPGWFYHAAEDSLVKSPERLFEIYLSSVGRGSTLLLNVPPDQRGQFHDNDLKSLKGFKELLDKTFALNLAKKAAVTASSHRGNSKNFSAANITDGNKNTFWATNDGVTTGDFEIDLGKTVTVNYILLQEFIRLGQRVQSFTVEVMKDNEWHTVGEGTTIGYKRILKIDPVQANRIRVSITGSKSCPVISNAEAY